MKVYPYNTPDGIIELVEKQELDELASQISDLGVLVDKLERERDEARAEAAKWKANHDNQVALKSAIIQRPDLRDRAERVQGLIKELNATKAQLKVAYDDLLYIATMLEYDQDDAHRLRNLGMRSASKIQAFLTP
jgi:outer membrane murein-binding lipoprotein Lpp